MTVTALKIEKGVPMRRVNRGPAAKTYPFADMSIGDSFLLAVPDNPFKTRCRVLNAARSYRVHGDVGRRGFTISTAAEGDAIRVWRTA